MRLLPRSSAHDNDPADSPWLVDDPYNRLQPNGDGLVYSDSPVADGPLTTGTLIVKYGQDPRDKYGTTPARIDYVTDNGTAPLIVKRAANGSLILPEEVDDMRYHLEEMASFNPKYKDDLKKLDDLLQDMANVQSGRPLDAQRILSLIARQRRGSHRA